jgi:hypothetical protein
MQPVEFKGQNAIFAKDQPEYLPLPALVLAGPEGAVISCWEFSDEEIEMLIKTKKLYISQFCFTRVCEDGVERINPLQPLRPAIELSDYFQLNEA